MRSGSVGRDTASSVSLRLEQRRDRLDGLGHRPRQVERGTPQLDLALSDARQIEQVVHEADHLLDLALDDVAGLADAGVRRPEQLQDFYGIEDRRHRVPQFVGEDGQELVLAAVGLAQLGRLDAQVLFQLS